MEDCDVGSRSDPKKRLLFFSDTELTRQKSWVAERIKHGKDSNLISDMNHYFISKFDHNRPFKWFDVELKKYFGIDVLDAGFPKEKGYGIFHGRKPMRSLFALRISIIVLPRHSMNSQVLKIFILKISKCPGKSIIQRFTENFLIKPNSRNHFSPAYMIRVLKKPFTPRPRLIVFVQSGERVCR